MMKASLLVMMEWQEERVARRWRRVGSRVDATRLASDSQSQSRALEVGILHTC